MFPPVAEKMYDSFVTTEWQLCERTVAWALFPCESIPALGLFPQ